MRIFFCHKLLRNILKISKHILRFKYESRSLSSLSSNSNNKVDVSFVCFSSSRIYAVIDVDEDIGPPINNKSLVINLNLFSEYR